MNGPTFFTKIAFWILLGFLSVFFAEVLVPSSIFPFFNAFSLIFTVPLYLLHFIILASLVYRFGKPTFPVLFGAGFIFGLYEAYATKVLWVPTWEVGSWDLFFGIHWSLVLVVVGFWHAFLSFIAPLLIADTFLVKGGGAFKKMPFFFQKTIKSPYWLFCVILLFGVLSTSVITNPVHLLSPLSSGLVVLCSLYLWRGNFGKYEMKDLLPQGLSFYMSLVPLLLLYVFAFFFIRAEFMPEALTPHLTILFLYSIAGVIFWINLKKSRVLTTVSHNEPFPWKKALITFLLFIGVGVFSFLFFPGRTVVLVLSWLPFGIISFLSIFYTLQKTFAK